MATVPTVNRTGLLSTSEGSNTGAFTSLDWGLLATASLVFGSSFLFMALGLDAFSPGVVSFGRIAFGFLALSFFPAAWVSVAREDWLRIAILGVTWSAVPLSLFPLAQQHISSAVAGMINGGTPLLVGLVASVLLRRLPGNLQLVGVAIGVVGIVLISLPSLGVGGDSALGVFMVIGAISGYGISLNLAVPLQQTYGSLPVIWRVHLVGAVLTAPRFFLGLPDSTFELRPFLAVVVLGAGGTGLAYIAMGTLGARVGSTRSSVITYLATPVAALLGVLFRNDVLEGVQLLGGALTLAGAWFASRSDKR